MPEPLQLLIVEDDPADAELLVGGLRRAGFDPRWQRVDDEAAFLDLLGQGLDLILSDYTLPNFSGLRAVELLRERGLDVPIIIISGMIGEDTAVEAIRLGASDYLMKDRLARLGSSVTRALAESRLRREHQAAIQALRASEQRFRRYFELGLIGMAITSPTRACVDVNDELCRILGFTRDELRTKTWADMTHPDDLQLDRDNFDRISAGEIEGYTVEKRFIRGDGRVVHALIAVKCERRADGSIDYLIGLVQDITESKSLREQFLRSQRMEAIGTLAGGIAHDLNNILAPVVIAPALLRGNIKTAHENQLLDLIEDGARRAANVIRQLLTFSQGTGSSRVRVQLRHLLGEMAKLMRETFPREIAIEDNASEDFALILGDPTELHQVIYNFCVNARDAMPSGGKLSLSAKNVEVNAATALAYPQASVGLHVAVSVADTGHGIPPEIIGRIFEPFFTTREPSKGSGLGLSTVLGIVRGHRGFVTVTSEPGCGATFTAYLPAALD